MNEKMRLTSLPVALETRPNAVRFQKCKPHPEQVMLNDIYEAARQDYFGRFINEFFNPIHSVMTTDGVVTYGIPDANFKAAFLRALSKHPQVSQKGENEFQTPSFKVMVTE